MRLPRPPALLLALLLAGPLHGLAEGGTKTRAEVDPLVQAVLPAAQEMLQAHGEFAPFGMGMSAGSEVVDIEPMAGRDRAEPGDPVGALRHSLSEALRSGSMRATALVYEVRLFAPPASTGGSDAIAVALARRDKYSAVLVYPYQFRDGRIVFGEPHVIEHNPPRAAGKRKR